jgi:hypothetical protein
MLFPFRHLVIPFRATIDFRHLKSNQHEFEIRKQMKIPWLQLEKRSSASYGLSVTDSEPLKDW